ncbi:MAG: patatin family protein [Alphaproteobacteria bacterium]|nr:patatin family protein [Alphaproteobacteria bacterium]
MKTGLVLEGGAHRAIYTAGVLDVFNENDIIFDGVVGVSAGAIHGCAFVSKQKGRSIGYTLKYANDRRYMSFYSWLTTGNLVGEQFCYHDLPEKLFPFDHQTFEASPTKFYATCTNLESGQAEYIYCNELRTKLPYIRASASMPFVSKISQIGNCKYLDGGIADSIPLRAFQNMGYERCVVVQTRATGYTKKKNKLAWLAKIMYRKYPKFANAVINRHLMYNQELKDIENSQKEGTALVIRPSREIKIRHTEHNTEVLQTVYNLGCEDALKALPKVKEFLQSAHRI